MIGALKREEEGGRGVVVTSRRSGWGVVVSGGDLRGCERLGLGLEAEEEEGERMEKGVAHS